jgi:hypothetical protein
MMKENSTNYRIPETSSVGALTPPIDPNILLGKPIRFSNVILSASEGSHALGYEILRWRSG